MSNNQCEHKWIHLDTKHIYRDHYPGLCRFKRVDRFFCEKCCETKEIVKRCMDDEDRHPEWFDFKNYITIRE